MSSAWWTIIASVIVIANKAGFDDHVFRLTRWFDIYDPPTVIGRPHHEIIAELAVKVGFMPAWFLLLIAFSFDRRHPKLLLVTSMFAIGMAPGCFVM